MRIALLTSIASVCLFLGACSHVPPQNEGQPASVDQVVRAIKADLLRYERYSVVVAQDAPLPNSCGGKVGFVIENVKVQLTTQTDDKVAGNASLTVPVGAATLGPSFSSSRETKGTQALTFSLFPKDAAASSSAGDKADAIAPADSSKYPITATLQKLRDGLLKASIEEPCFSLSSPNNDKDSVSSFAFGFTIINDTSAGGAIKFVVFSLGASTDLQRQVGNVISVNFRAIGGSASYQ